MADLDETTPAKAPRVADLTLHRRSLERAPQSASAGPTLAPQVVSFHRRELQEILGLYGRMVAAGEWRDYAMDFTPHKAVFSIYRRTSETPLYRVEKDPRLAHRQGVYSVVAATGLILKRGNDLTRVLAVLERPLKLIR